MTRMIRSVVLSMSVSQILGCGQKGDVCNPSGGSTCCSPAECYDQNLGSVTSGDGICDQFLVDLDAITAGVLPELSKQLYDELPMTLGNCDRAPASLNPCEEAGVLYHHYEKKLYNLDVHYVTLLKGIRIASLTSSRSSSSGGVIVTAHGMVHSQFENNKVLPLYLRMEAPCTFTGKNNCPKLYEGLVPVQVNSFSMDLKLICGNTTAPISQVRAESFKTDLSVDTMKFGKYDVGSKLESQIANAMKSELSDFIEGDDSVVKEINKQILSDPLYALATQYICEQVSSDLVV